jgi:hypothetical protein
MNVVCKLAHVRESPTSGAAHASSLKKCLWFVKGMVAGLLRDSADSAAIRRTVLTLVLVSPHLALDVRADHRCPAFLRPARIVGRGRVGRAGHFAMHGPIQARW